MKEYNAPEFEKIKYKTEDVLSTSDPNAPKDDNAGIDNPGTGLK